MPDGIPTMSSLQIAEITGKQHGHVMRDIRVILAELHGEGGVSKFGDTHTNPQNGQAYPIFQLPERELLVLLTGYSATLRAKVIDQWQSMKAHLAAPSLPEMLRLAASAMEENERLKLEVAEQSPKVEALRLLSISDGSTCISRAAKALGVTKIKELFDWLHEKKWIFKREGEWIAHQDRLRSGHLEDKVTTVERGDGSSRTCHQTLVTPKGLARLAEIFGDKNGGLQA